MIDKNIAEKLKKEFQYEIISDSGKLAMLLTDLYINKEKVLPIYDKISTKTLLDIEEWKNLKKEEMKDVVV
ncbi:MAG: hypothetical protein QW795_03435 [Candidatus Bathyarchaeia archaeon]